MNKITPKAQALGTHLPASINPLEKSSGFFHVY
jgi:hypothetical protein